MAQTAKIISPNKKVLLPNMNSGCLMADMVNLEQLREFKAKNKNVPVVCYVNSTAEVKAECDICVTSSNAIKVVKSLNAPEILFLPDTYLGKYVEEEKEEDVLSNPNNHIYYVDGSYLNGIIGWGFVHVKNREVLDKKCGGIVPTPGTSRNITGELESAKMAIRDALSNGLKEIYIVNDYQGISSYITGAWKPDKQESKDYTNWVNSVKDKISIKFVKVKGHTNNIFNDMVDEMAKLGTSKLKQNNF